MNLLLAAVYALHSNPVVNAIIYLVLLALVYWVITYLFVIPDGLKRIFNVVVVLIIVLVLLACFTGCAQPTTAHGPDTKQKYDTKEGYNFGS